MGNENSTSQSHQRPGIWMLTRKGDPAALRAGIARISPEVKASYLNWTDQFGQRTPVAMATILDFPECVKILLDAGADGNRIGSDGMGPLDLAVQADNVAVVKLLIESSQVDCNVVDARGYSPLLSAAADGQVLVLAELLHCERVDLFACQAKTGLDVLGIVRKSYSKASSKDRPRFKECLGLVEQRLLIRSGYLYEFVNSKAAKQWVWERRNYMVFRTADSRFANIDFYLNNSDNPSVEMKYHCTQSNQKSDISVLGLSKAQASFTDRELRFALRANVTVKKHTCMQVFECAASSAEDMAFWINLPGALRTSRYSVLESTTSSISGQEEAREQSQERLREQSDVLSERSQEPQEEPQPRESVDSLSQLQTLQRQSELLEQQLRRLQEDQKRLQEQEEQKRRQKELEEEQKQRQQELEEQQRILREQEEQRIQREQEEQRLQQERLEQLVQERLQERLEQEREERRLEQERLELIIQERLQQEQEEQRQQQERMEQMRLQLEELENREMERVMQLSLDESSNPSAPAFDGMDLEQLAAAQEAMDSKSTECLVCYDAVRNAVCVPCGHISMCVDCANEVKRSSKKCIVCRANILTVVKIFHA